MLRDIDTIDTDTDTDTEADDDASRLHRSPPSSRPPHIPRYRARAVFDLLDEADYFGLEGMRSMVREALEVREEREQSHRSRLDALEEMVRRVAAKAGVQAQGHVFSTEVDF